MTDQPEPQHVSATGWNVFEARAALQQRGLDPAKYEVTKVTNIGGVVAETQSFSRYDFSLRGSQT